MADQPATTPPAKKAAILPAPGPLPTLKDDLAALAIQRGVPSYEAWAMTVDELKKKLEA